jgi:Flp pilus assembly protein TadD
MRKYDEAIEDFSQAIRLHPTAAAYFCRGAAYKDKKEFHKAIEDYSQAIRLDPEDAYAHGNLAWLLATCPKDSLRDGNKAIEHATKATKARELSQKDKAFNLDCLAAAYAETGNFKDASRLQKTAIELRHDGKEEMEKARQRLKLYEEGKPYRDK